MQRYLLTAALAAVVLPATPALARNAQGYTVHATVLYAGPRSDYPRLRRLRGNVAVTVHGCLEDRRWCDVTYRSDRGWIEGSDLAIDYRGRRSPLGDGMGIGILSFMIGSYWDDNYRSRPFYGQRDRWAPNESNDGRQDWNGQFNRNPRPQARQPQAPAYRPYGNGAGQAPGMHGAGQPGGRDMRPNQPMPGGAHGNPAPPSPHVVSPMPGAPATRPHAGPGHDNPPGNSGWNGRDHGKDEAGKADRRHD